ncbi:hypothetical protein PR048_006492 [Dryococelus australis]|uniref:Uncharacterized protein n=1 Tax=Dryococelus australis TaxID=614101 RepID=A0ABQ9IB64_9NEOP|nr:hypothetical protein PR048_006492 [Dryococelus australis]
MSCSTKTTHSSDEGCRVLARHLTYTEHDEYTARQFRALRLAAMGHLMLVEVSTLSIPRSSASNASKVKQRGSNTGDTNTHAYCFIAPTRKACSVSAWLVVRRERGIWWRGEGGIDFMLSVGMLAELLYSLAAVSSAGGWLVIGGEVNDLPGLLHEARLSLLLLLLIASHSLPLSLSISTPCFASSLYPFSKPIAASCDATRLPRGQSRPMFRLALLDSLSSGMTKNELSVVRERFAYSANCNRTRQQNGVTCQQHVETSFANQGLETFSPLGSPTNGECFVTCDSQSETRPALRASRRRSANGYDHIRGTSAMSIAGMQGQRKREIPEKTRRPEALSCTIPIYEKPGSEQSNHSVNATPPFFFTGERVGSCREFGAADDVKCLKFGFERNSRLGGEMPPCHPQSPFPTPLNLSSEDIPVRAPPFFTWHSNVCWSQFLCSTVRMTRRPSRHQAITITITRDSSSPWEADTPFDKPGAKNAREVPMFADSNYRYYSVIPQLGDMLSFTSILRKALGTTANIPSPWKLSSRSALWI